MSETKLVVDHLKLSYEGLFSVTELYQLIDSWLREKGFDKRETRNQEHVTSEGKYIELVLQPWKKVTDYAKHEIKIQIHITRLKDVEVKKNGHKMKLNNGRVLITLDGYLVTDYENRW